MLGPSSFILALLAAVAANPGLVLHENVDTVPVGFTLQEPVASQTMLDLRIALRQNDIAGLEKVFLDISNPDSAQYGRHLSQQQVDSYVEPSAETASKVNSWLSSYDLTATNVTRSGDWIQVSVPAGKANNMLHANFTLFNHTGSGKQTIRTLAYSIPAELQSHIDLVHPTVKYVWDIMKMTKNKLTRL
jgi:tripeptidyl-peptidase I